MRLRYFAAGLAAFVLCGFGIPGPQGSAGGGTFTGGTLTSDLNMGDNDILGANVIQPTTGETLTINEEGGAAALVVDTSGVLSQRFFYVRSSLPTGLVKADFAASNTALGVSSDFSFRFGSDTNYASGDTDLVLRRGAAAVAVLDGDGAGATAAKLAVAGIAPMASSTTLTLYDQAGAAALTVGTTGSVTAAGDVNYSTDWYTSAGTVTLTDETATTIFTLSVPQGSGAGGTISLSIYCEDGTDEQIHSEDITWAAVNKTGTITQEIATATTLDADADSTGTLTATYTITEDTADVISFKVNANTSLTTPTTFRVRFRVGSDTSGVTVP